MAQCLGRCGVHSAGGPGLRRLRACAVGGVVVLRRGRADTSHTGALSAPCSAAAACILDRGLGRSPRTALDPRGCNGARHAALVQWRPRAPCLAASSAEEVMMVTVTPG